MKNHRSWDKGTKSIVAFTNSLVTSISVGDLRLFVRHERSHQPDQEARAIANTNILFASPFPITMLVSIEIVGRICSGILLGVRGIDCDISHVTSVPTPRSWATREGAINEFEALWAVATNATEISCGLER